MKVRLKLKAAKISTSGEKFQFHEGPIKTMILSNLRVGF